jgi:hypothetical protein
MAFEATDKFLVASDPVTGATIKVHSVPLQIEFLEVVFSSPQVARFRFEIWIALNDAAAKTGARTAAIKLPADSINSQFRSLNMTDTTDNSELVKYILSGLQAINKKWPLARPPIFWSDYENLSARGKTFLFQMPSSAALREQSTSDAGA